MKKIGMMATYPKRFSSLFETIPTIDNQLSQLYIYCNNFDQDRLTALREWLKERNVYCDHHVIDSDFADGNIRDMGKFWPIGIVEGYIFLLDDDLIYPEDYCERHIISIEDHKSISTVHGRLISNFPLEKYYRDTVSFHYQNELRGYRRVDIPGTGTVAFRSDYSPDFFLTDNQAEEFKGAGDIWMAVQANMYGEEIYCLPRPNRWLVDSENSSMEESLYRETKENDEMQCSILNQFSWND